MANQWLLWAVFCLSGKCFRPDAESRPRSASSPNCTMLHYASKAPMRQKTTLVMMQSLPTANRYGTAGVQWRRRQSPRRSFLSCAIVGLRAIPSIISSLHGCCDGEECQCSSHHSKIDTVVDRSPRLDGSTSPMGLIYG